MGGAVADLTNLFLPSDCRICHAAHVATHRTRLGSVRICEVCFEKLTADPNVPPETLCVRCGEDLGMESARFAASMGLRECTMCRLAPPEFTRAIAFGTYDNEIRELLHLLKFEGQRKLAEQILGEQLVSTILRLGISATEMVVVPVPLFKARQRERGFNQAEVLAKAAMKTLRRSQPGLKLTLSPALERVKDTRPLYRLDPRQRRRNLKGAFRIADRDAVRGREVLLIDDIMTTGATARECSAVLLRAGAARVWVATVARAQPRAAATTEFAVWERTAAQDNIIH